MAKKIAVPESSKELPLAVVRQMITLATSGFGLVAALAWNEFVKSVIEGYIRPYLPSGSPVISLLIYAIIVTSLAVIITLQLAKIEKRLQREKEAEAAKK